MQFRMCVLQNQDPFTAPSAYGGALGDEERLRLQAQAIANVQAALGKAVQTKGRSDEAHFRQAAGTKWVDPTLSEWPEGATRLPHLTWLHNQLCYEGLVCCPVMPQYFAMLRRGGIENHYLG